MDGNTSLLANVLCLQTLQGREKRKMVLEICHFKIKYILKRKDDIGLQMKWEFGVLDIQIDFMQQNKGLDGKDLIVMPRI